MLPCWKQKSLRPTLKNGFEITADNYEVLMSESETKQDQAPASSEETTSTTETAVKRETVFAKPWTWPMPAQVIVGIAVGILLGWMSGSTGPMIGDADRFVYSLVGGLFMNGLKMIAVPLVMISIIVGLAELGNRPGFARLGGRPYCIMSEHRSLLPSLV